jgi:predicted NUDIX family phosphoesterase
LGVVHLFELDQPHVAAREEGLAEASFLQVAQVRALHNEFETWSQICIDSLLRAG